MFSKLNKFIKVRSHVFHEIRGASRPRWLFDNNTVTGVVGGALSPSPASNYTLLATFVPNSKIAALLMLIVITYSFILPPSTIIIRIFIIRILS